ncbi:MAG: hypothetical protein ACK569_03545 [Hyphomonadaceae bacterium]
MPRAFTIPNEIAVNAASFAQANPVDIGLSDHDSNSDKGKRIVRRYRETPFTMLELNKDLANLTDIIDPLAKVASYLT